MDTRLVVRIEWAWGGSVIAHAHSSDVLFDVLASHGFASVGDFRLAVAHRGEFIDVEFSFHHYGIHTGDRLICLLKRVSNKEKFRRFLESMPQSPRFTPRPMSITDKSKVSQRIEEARLADLSFAAWETMDDFPLVANDLLKQQEALEKPSDGGKFPTIVIESKLLREDPLPSLFPFESPQGSGIPKMGYECSSGYVKDIPDRAAWGHLGGNDKE